LLTLAKMRGISGTIRLGLVPAMTRSLAGPALRCFMEKHPNVRILLSEYSSPDLIDEVAADRIANLNQIIERLRKPEPTDPRVRTHEQSCTYR
jgi:hypothetical protein